MAEHTIANLQEVLSKTLKRGMKIVNTNITSLTAPGENYGSIMSKLDITVKNEENGTTEEIHAVAKQIPAQEFARMIFNVQITFKNEIAMYDTIVPTLQNFQRENGVTQVIDCFPKLLGARINLGDKNGIVDEDGVLILENLLATGYQAVDRYVGFDLETTLLILKDLAAFHAIPLALRLKRPKVFEEKIRPYMAPFEPPSMPHEKEFNEVIVKLLEYSNKCAPLAPKVRNMFKNMKEIRRAPPKELFLTLTHGDMWVNNTMVKFRDGLPVHNKLVDFQVCDYKSAATDLFFFLFSSVQLPVLQEGLDSLIGFYHKHFTSHLEQLRCDVVPFSLPIFLEEMKVATTAEIPHTLTMTVFIVFGKKGGRSEEFNPEAKPDFEEIEKNIPQEAKEKIWFIVEECRRHGWL